MRSHDRKPFIEFVLNLFGMTNRRLSVKHGSRCGFLLPFLVFMTAAIIVCACSTEKNTAQTRWWHSFTARYNTFYNGSLAYIDGSLAKEQGNKDNFTEMLPLYTVGNKSSLTLGASNFDKAIEKSQKAIKQHSIKKRPEWKKSRKKTERDLEWLNRKEYNPFLWKAWMLMGRSQFHKGAFDEAASTFAYMARLYQSQPAIYGRARAWLAKCYVELDWIYDAEDVINKMNRDSIDWRAMKEWNYTYADYYLHTGRLEEAVPYLQKVIKQEMRKKQKARELFLLGQVQAALGHNEQSYKAFRRVVRTNPPYELEFNARIAMTEVMAGGRPKKMISRLKRMARSEKNKDYLDQVYYAIGNIYMSEKDTVNAIAAYEEGNKKATRSGIEKGVLLLHLGDLYWQTQKFNDAQRCYGEAIGLLDKDRPDYKQLSERSKVLDQLVPFTDAVHLQDSLQWLAKLPETERNAAIDRVIEELIKKEKEEKKKQQEEEAEQVLQKEQNRGGARPQDKNPQQKPPTQQSQPGVWYFYNPLAVSQGKQAFQKLWGKRENIDNWRRSNQTVVASATGAEEFTDEMRDSLARAAEVEDSLKQVTDSAQNDPHKREYYLAQIPFTEEQVEASNLIIMDGLYNSGVIFKDKLDMLDLSERQLRRLTDSYPTYEHMDDAYYHLWLLYQRKHQPQVSATYLSYLQAKWPESTWTKLLSDPYYVENARIGEHLEDSIYAATYAAFKDNRFDDVRVNTNISAERFPLGYHRDKFIFIGGLSKLNAGDSDGCLKDMEEVVKQYPQSEVSNMAGMIINGVKAGRKLHGGRFDMGDVWARRTVVMNDSDSIAARKFEAEREVDFVFMLAYEPDSVNQNQLLFEMARFNFTSFVARNFDLEIEDIDGLRRMRVSGFHSYDEVLQYARQLFANASIAQLAKRCRTILISTKNLELLGTNYSYNDYDEFYEQHFIPLKISTVLLLTEPESIEYERQPEPAPTDNQDENDDLYNGGVIDDNMLMNLDIDEGIDVSDDDGSVEVPTPAVPATEEPAPVPTTEKPTPAVPTPVPAAEENEEMEDDGTFEIPETEPVERETPRPVTPQTEPEKPQTTQPVTPQSEPEKPQTTQPVTPKTEPEKPVTPQTQPEKPQTTQPVTPQTQPVTPQPDPDDEEIIIIDEDEAPTPPAAKPQTPTANGQKPSANGQKPSTSGQKPTANSQKPTANGQKPTANSQQPQTPAANGQKPTANGQQPTAKTQEPEVDDEYFEFDGF